MTVPMTCPDTACWTALLDGQLPESEQTELTEHLDRCPVCQQFVERLTEETGAWEQAAQYLPGNDQANDPRLKEVMERLKEVSVGKETSTDLSSTGANDLNFLTPDLDLGHLGCIGRYQVLGVIGRGGMGVVLKARDPGLDRLVAIKVLAPQLAASTPARVRFDREARAMAQLHHENVVAVHGVDEFRGLPYLVMEFIRGTSLDELLVRQGALPLIDVVRIGAQIASGLDAAHRQSLVHRDVKPANVLLERGTDKVKLTDFGLARAVDDASVTQSGVLAGTPLFMAPEQARGEPVDARSDLFSLGSVLYTMCAGKPPFQGSSLMAVLRQVSEASPPSLRKYRRRLPEWLIEIVEVLHAREPGERFASAAEVAELLGWHLEHLKDPQRVPAPPALRRRRPVVRRRSWLLVASCVGLLGLVFLMIPAALGCWWWLTHRGSTEAGVGEAQPANKEPAGQRARKEAEPPGGGAKVPEESVELTNGRVPFPGGPPWPQLHYRFLDRGPQPGTVYVWVASRANRPFPDAAILPLGEQRIMAPGLAAEGDVTLPQLHVAMGWSVEVCLAIQKPPSPQSPVPTYERISNVLRISR